MCLKYLTKLTLLFFIFSVFVMYFVLTNQTSLALILLLAFCLVFYFFSLKNVIIFDSFFLFSTYYCTFIPAALYLHFTGISENIFIKSQSFSLPLMDLFNLALVFILIGYLFAFIGYKIFSTDRFPVIKFVEKNISLKAAKLLFSVFSLIGASNFFWNIMKFANGNLLRYLQNLSQRRLEFLTEGGTTIFYLFSYLSAYLLYYIYLRSNKKLNWFFITYVFFTILIKASVGRITATLTYTLSFFVISYFSTNEFSVFAINLKKRNFKYMLFLVSLSIFGVIFFFYRFYSSLLFNDLLDTGFWDMLANDLSWNEIGYFAFGKGNAPNIPVLIKIIDSWSHDIPFLYGSSLFTWIFGFLPSSIRPVGYQPSALIKNIWYPHIIGGNLPPTGIGEMYANFWFLGPALGMLLFGLLAGYIYKLLVKKSSYWYLLVYANIVLNFIFIYPKGEFDNLSLWHIVPYVFMYYLLILFTKLMRFQSKQT